MFTGQERDSAGDLMCYDACYFGGYGIFILFFSYMYL